MRSARLLTRQWWILLAGCGGIWGGIALASLSTGTPALSLPQLYNALSVPVRAEVAHVIVWDLRLPRLLLATMAGAMLAVAGLLLQETLHNPLAGPELLGVSAGAALVVVAIVILKLPAPFGMLPWLALWGGLIGGALTLLVTRIAQDSLRVILAGAAVTAFLNALVVTLISLGTQSEVGALFQYLLGSLANRSWPAVQLLWPWALGGLALALTLGRTLDVLQLGDELAAGLGVSVSLIRMVLLITSAGLVAAVVAVGGQIGWVALLAPHIARQLVGYCPAWQRLVLTACAGALLLSLADLAARLALAPVETPVGIWTTLVGGPVLLGLVLGRRQ